MLNAVITAGGRVDGPFAERIGTTVKALAPLGERRMIDAAIDAARGAGAEAVAVVGGAEVGAHCGARVDRMIDESSDGAENARRALGAFSGARLLYLTSDLPFVDASGLRAFVAGARDAVAAMPLADSATYEERFRDAPPHVMELGGERFANGSVFLLDGGALQAVTRLAGAFFNARKAPWRLAALCGPPLLLRYALRRLRVADLEARAARLLGGPVRAVRGCDPGLCYDVDSLEEWEYAARWPVQA